MKDIPCIRGRKYIAGLIAEGEHVQQDFKFMISDARKIARSISAFANNAGGRLLIGVKDNGTVAGIRNEEDIYMVELAAERYCRPAQDVQFTAFSVDPGVVVIRASIARSSERPVCVVEDDGSLHAYYRVADENISAPPLMVRSWQLQASGEPLSFTGDGPEQRLLELLNEHHPRGTTSRALALAAHTPLAMTEEILARFAAVGLAQFVFDGSAFKIAPDSSEE